MRLRFLLVLAWLLLAAGCASTPPAPSRIGPVILVSIDGFRPDYLDRGDTPTLNALAAAGVRAEAMKPAFPSLTFPNHYTLVTGLYPDHHGIVNNRMVDPISGARFVYNDAKTTADPTWWGGEPIWVSAEKQGVHAATMFWPGSDVAIAGVRPSRWLPFDGKMKPDARVDQLLAWIDLPPPERARFYTLYFEQIDHAAHQDGPASAGVDAALREVDAALARLLDGLKRRGLSDRANLVIVSDHGGTATARERLIYLEDLVGDDEAESVNLGILAGLNPRSGRTADVEAKLLRPHEHMRCWRKTEVPARLHYGTHPRVPALLCLADDGWLITTREYQATRKRFSLGEHGYDNDDPNMRALFIAQGPAFKRGLVVPEFPNVDVYPLLMHLLGLTPRPNDGDLGAVAPMLTAPSAALSR
ncbi:ectonucleotide pyrophosphatase/phosphodiesterase [Dokdonella sp.]|uniref:alkaline phosphatase family protein n=1 Tax=Dokdonella sp. TaxID=2291710 RepID=UPI001B294129|nr:ectonucleotide pyrophosphatase/phosphodiesterase [Dokdonella sp.]MBO9664077.1 alkaline phosphatase family protein [Dokdonella sp.]